MINSILITGGSGFIGTHLCSLLRKKGKRVRVLDLAMPLEPLDGVEYVRGDVRDPDTVALVMQDIQAVYHFAALVSVPHCQQHPMESYLTNLQSTLILLESIRKKEKQTSEKTRLIFSSTAAVYGNRGTYGQPLTEDDVAQDPSSFYAAQKLGSEQLIRLFHQNFKIPAVVFRFFNVFGPGQDPSSPYSGVISVFLENLRHFRSFRLNGGGVQTRDFVSVYDITEACFEALTLSEKQCDGNAINLGTSAAIKISELAQKMMKDSGIMVPIEHAPARDGDVLHSLANINRAEKILGWKARFSLEQGLSELYPRLS